MTLPFISMDDGDRMLCPKCGGNYVHIDEVFVAGRPREDGEIKPVHVDSGGRVSAEERVSLPIPDVGRRHAIALKGWCELCSAEFAVEFVQHKGQTLLAFREPQWTPMTPSLHG